MRKHVKLRSLKPTDAEAYYRIVKAPSVAEGAGFPLVKSFPQARGMLREDLRSGRNFAVTLAGQLIGVINLYATIGAAGAPNDHDLELGYFMRTDEQGRGYMTAAVRQLVGLMQRASRVDKLVADVSENNPASSWVLRRNGFVSYHAVLDLMANHENLIFERRV